MPHGRKGRNIHEGQRKIRSPEREGNRPPHKAEPAVRDAAPGDKFQFVRFGYFCKDTRHGDTFNQVVSLKDAMPKK